MTQSICDTTGLLLDKTFQNFVRGTSNEPAVTAAQTISKVLPNNGELLFLHGGSGLGKTHLLHAIGNSAHQEKHNVIYLTTDQFNRKRIESITEDKFEWFHQYYQKCDVLLLDDFQEILGKPATLSEYFSLFALLVKQNVRIVIACNEFPSEEINSLKGLICGCLNSLIVELNLPDFMTKLAIIQKKVEEKKVILNKEVMERIASKPAINVWDIEGVLTKLEFISSHKKQEITPELAVKHLFEIRSYV